MGINGRLRSEGGGVLEVGDLRLRQHRGESLAAIIADAILRKTTSEGDDAC